MTSLPFPKPHREPKEPKPLRVDPEKARAWRERTRRALPRFSARQKARIVTLAEVTVVLVDRTGGYCQARIEGVCPDGPHLGEHAHHVRRRSQGGADSIANLRWICQPSHSFIHANPKTAALLGLLDMTKESEDAA